MHVKRLMIGTLGIGMFLVFLFYVGIWGIGEYMDTTTMLHQLDLKVNQPGKPTMADVSRTIDRQKVMENHLARVERLIALPIDERGRRVLQRSDAELLAEDGSWDWRAYWNQEMRVQQIRDIPLSNEKFTLHIPFNPHWGNAVYAVSHYEREGEDVLFGNLIDSEVTGVYREIRFSTTHTRPLREILMDPDHQQESCVGDRSAPTQVKIGRYMAVRIFDSTCELNQLTYIVLGKQANYIFSSHPFISEEKDIPLLRWTVEHFEER